jgi:hypothetical protein
MNNDPKWIDKCIKNYQKSLGCPLCELPDYDFNESFDIDFLRCQYDATAIELINRADESIEDRRYGTAVEVRDREATRILSTPTRPRARPRAPLPPPPPNYPPPLIAEQQLIYELIMLSHQPIPPPPQAPQAPRVTAPQAPRVTAPQAPQATAPPRSNRPVIKIALDVSKSTDQVGSCGICLTDDIPIAKTVQTNCKHEYCDACMTQIIRRKPCCAFCRANITRICVNSLDVYNKMLNK